MIRRLLSFSAAAAAAAAAIVLSGPDELLANNHWLAAAPREVEIVGLDYAFRLPRELPAGLTTFRLVNKGKVAHEFNIVLLKQDVTLSEYMTAVNTEKPLGSLTDATVGVLFADPGESSPSGLTTELLAGRTYAVRCIFKDNKDAPRHQAMGMFGEIHVSSAKPPPAPPLRVDTIVGMDYTFRAPATLSPGTHYVAFVNNGKQRHEVNIALLRKGATLQQLLEAAGKGGNIRELLEAGLGVLHSPGGTTPRGLLRFDMLPGREYLLVCAFADSTNAPPHFALGMVGTIRVDGASAKP